MPQTPNQKRATDAVAAWLAQQGKNNAWLVDAASADPGTIGDFLAYKRWPKIGTQGRIERALGWPPGVIRQMSNGADPDDLIPVIDETTVGGDGDDAGYVAAPGDRVEGGSSDDDVLDSIRAMREEMRVLREAVERLADGRQPRS